MSIGVIPGRFFQKDEPKALARHFGEGSLFSLLNTLPLQRLHNFSRRERAACLHLFALSCLSCLFSFIKTCLFFVLTKILWTLAWPFEGGPPRCASFGLFWSSANWSLINRYVDTRISIFIERFFKRDSF